MGFESSFHIASQIDSLFSKNHLICNFAMNARFIRMPNRWLSVGTIQSSTALPVQIWFQFTAFAYLILILWIKLQLRDMRSRKENISVIGTIVRYAWNTNMTFLQFRRTGFVHFAREFATARDVFDKINWIDFEPWCFHWKKNQNLSRIHWIDSLSKTGQLWEGFQI